MKVSSVRRPVAFDSLRAILAGISVGTLSAGTEPEKSSFNLFRPTPPELMRELSTDRPDKTETPYTVDAGHLQIEMDLATFTYDRHNSERSDTRVESWTLGAVNVKVGLLNNIDFQVVFEPWTTTRTVQNPGHVTQRADGFGDIALRTKINAWGNDGGTIAVAFMPFVKIPTAEDDLGNGAVEGGLIVPVAVELPAGWSMGMMAEVDFAEDSDGDGYHTDLITTITFAHDLTDRLGAYVEFFSAVSSERHVPWVGTFDLGLTYAISDDIQLDAGVNIGLTRSADDVNPFLGLSWRF